MRKYSSKLVDGKDRAPSRSMLRAVGFKDKDFKNMRKWVADNIHVNDANTIFRKIYDTMYEYLKPQSVPVAVLKIADYQYKNVHVADPEVNLTAFFTEIMVDCEFM